MSGALHIPAQATLDSVNELLKTATPVGAYCLGIVCTDRWKHRKEPSRALLERAVKLQRVADTVALLGDQDVKG